MTVKVSVIVPFADSRATIDTIVRSLDAQTLPCREFEVIFVDRGSTDGTDVRLARFAGRRPNVTVIPAEASLGAAEVRGDYVVRLNSDDGLVEDALARVHDYAVRSDATAVAGHRVGESNGTPSFVAYQTAALQKHGVEVAAENFSETANLIGVAPMILPGPPLLRGPGVDALVPSPELTVRSSEVDWSADRLRIRWSASLSSPAGEPTDQLLARLVVDHRQSGQQVELPTSFTPAGAEGGVLLHGVCELVLPGEERWVQQRGTWYLRLAVTAPGRRWVTPVRAGRPPSAILGSNLVGLYDSPLGLALYFDGARNGFFGAIPAEASFTESAAGNAMALPLPNVHGHRAAASGLLVIGSVAAPATIEERGGQLELRSWISGLPGSHPLAVRFGGPAVRLALNLRIGVLGDCRLETPPPPVQPEPETAKQQPAQAPVPAARTTSTTTTKKKKKRKRRRLTRVEKLRRRLPGPLVTVVGRMPGTRAIYQELIRRSRARRRARNHGRVRL